MVAHRAQARAAQVRALSRQLVAAVVSSFCLR